MPVLPRRIARRHEYLIFTRNKSRKLFVHVIECVR
jgi:hypothetical protein